MVGYCLPRGSSNLARLEVLRMQYPVILRERPVEPMLEHQIRLRAYDLFLQRGRGPGHALDAEVSTSTEARW